MKNEYFNTNTGTTYIVEGEGAGFDTYICKYGEINENGDFITEGICTMTGAELRRMDK